MYSVCSVCSSEGAWVDLSRLCLIMARLIQAGGSARLCAAKNEMGFDWKNTVFSAKNKVSIEKIRVSSKNKVRSAKFASEAWKRVVFAWKRMVLSILRCIRSDLRSNLGSSSAAKRALSAS